MTFLPMDIQSYFEIAPTAAFIRARNFSTVVLQFPIELSEVSPFVERALNDELRNGGSKDVSLFIMPVAEPGSCCVNEVDAMRGSGAECVIHYGHTCLSQTSILPAYFVFGEAVLSISDCVQHITDCAAATDKPILVLYGLEYAYAIQNVRQTLMKDIITNGPGTTSEFVFADVMCSVMEPYKGDEDSNRHSDGTDTVTSTKYSIGGLTWSLPDGRKMEDCLLFWIGSENKAFSNVILTFNGCEIVRYDAGENHSVTEFLQQRRFLNRRYYLVEKAKDANIVGILVSTLSVAGYKNMVDQIKDLVTKAGKKPNLIVLARPTPAKLANFPQCEVFIHVTCAQTALVDSKEFLAPLITPFEAILAFNRGSQWTGAYVMDFRRLNISSPVDTKEQSKEARYSFFQGGYVEDVECPEEANEEVLALSQTTDKSLQSSGKCENSLSKRVIKSGAEFLATRSYQGLELPTSDSSPEPYVIGRSGKASGYADEKSCKRS